MYRDPLFVAALVIACCNFALLLTLYVKSHHWTGPSLSIRMEHLEASEQIVRGNLARVDRDLTALHRSTTDSFEHIMRELENIRGAISTEVSLRRSVEELTEDVEECKRMRNKEPV